VHFKLRSSKKKDLGASGTPDVQKMAGAGFSLLCSTLRCNIAECHNTGISPWQTAQVKCTADGQAPRSQVAKIRCSQAYGNPFSNFNLWLWQSTVGPFSVFQSAEIVLRIAVVIYVCAEF
jgi:hypothetical protein